MISLTISRASLSLADLVLSDDPAGDYVLTEDGQGRPDVVWEYGHAPKSGDMHGRVLLTATKDMSSLPFVVNVHGVTAAALRINEQALTDALEQWSYTVTQNINGQAVTYSCDPTSPRWGDVDSGMTRAHLSRASVVIPVYPIGA